MPQPPSTSETTRVEAFSDGVFAIAVTLLILEVKVPHLPEHATATDLWRELAKQWPSYLALVSSFFTVLIIWTNHHGLFKLISGTNNRFMFANGFLLLIVTLVPFPTALVAEYIMADSASTACAVYAGLYVLIAVAFGMLWETALKTGLVRADVPSHVLKATSRNSLVGIGTYVLATIVAFFSPYLSIALCTVLWIYWGYAISHN